MIRPPMAFTDWALGGLMDGLGEWISSLFMSVVLSMAKLTQDLLFSAFDTAQVGDGTWHVVRGEGNGGFVDMWVMIMLPVLVAIIALQVTIAAFKRNKAGIIRGFVGGVLGVPVSYWAVWLIEQILKAMDETTQFIMDSIDSTPVDAIMRVIGFTPLETAENGFGYVQDVTHWVFWTGGPGSPVLIAVVVVLLAAVAALVLNAMMIFRGFALAVAASLAPVVIMMMPLEASKSWFTKWSELVVGLLLAKPLAFAVLVFSMALFNGDRTINGTMMGLVGMVIAAMMPLIAMKFISFTPASSTSDMDSASKGASQAPGRVAATVFRARSMRRR